MRETILLRHYTKHLFVPLIFFFCRYLNENIFIKVREKKQKKENYRKTLNESNIIDPNTNEF